ncbi:hypothetical protein [Burkholderia ambifaria]|uniref:hypothetical protein n=1 Tax=Burkholderia ambifaria TaxID=152480 RepID=UPI00158A0AB9|nr:hypothetical protein [Burkholderia ambifaria]
MNFVQQASDFGAQGTAYFGELARAAPPSAAMQQATFYFKPASGTGFLCTTLNPLTRNLAGAADPARIARAEPVGLGAPHRPWMHLLPSAYRRYRMCAREPGATS